MEEAEDAIDPIPLEEEEEEEEEPRMEDPRPTAEEEKDAPVRRRLFPGNAPEAEVECFQIRDMINERENGKNGFDGSILSASSIARCFFLGQWISITATPTTQRRSEAAVFVQ